MRQVQLWMLMLSSFGCQVAAVASFSFGAWRLMQQDLLGMLVGALAAAALLKAAVEFARALVVVERT